MADKLKPGTLIRWRYDGHDGDKHNWTLLEPEGISNGEKLILPPDDPGQNFMPGDVVEGRVTVSDV